MKTLMIQGTSSGSGKSTMVTALCRIFSDMGISVAPYKSQNMSNFAYSGDGFEISRAQAIQAIGARTKIIPAMNPILLKPLGDYYSMVYLNGKKFKKMHAAKYYSEFATSRGLQAALLSLKSLQKNFELVIIEGAGSPAEINLQKFDIANMAIAEKTRSPVVLVADTDRGGSFAGLVGTLELLNKRHRDLVRGFVFNKFRGDVEILKPGFSKIRQITKKEIFGVIPMIKLEIPDEDSLDLKSPDGFSWTRRSITNIDREIDKLADTVQRSLDMKAIKRTVYNDD